MVIEVKEMRRKQHEKFMSKNISHLTKMKVKRTYGQVVHRILFVVAKLLK